jgi:nitroreductase
MDLFDAIARRHCYRGAYLPQPVSREDLRKIVQAGLDAPSGKNGQTTTFVVVDDAAILSKIRPLHDSNKAMQQARAYIACVIDREPEAFLRVTFFRSRIVPRRLKNMLLAVTRWVCQRLD